MMTHDDVNVCDVMVRSESTNDDQKFYNKSNQILILHVRYKKEYMNEDC